MEQDKMTSPFSVQPNSLAQEVTLKPRHNLLERSGNAQFKFGNLQNCPPKNIKIRCWINKKRLATTKPPMTRFPYTQST